MNPSGQRRKVMRLWTLKPLPEWCPLALRALGDGAERDLRIIEALA